MKNIVIIGDKTFEFKIPENLTTSDVLNDWCKLYERENKNKNEDIWTVIPELPQYKFKNLKIKSSPFQMNDETVEMTITFKYDEFKEIN
jgi:hypothetical protein